MFDTRNSFARPRTFLTFFYPAQTRRATALNLEALEPRLALTVAPLLATYEAFPGGYPTSTAAAHSVALTPNGQLACLAYHAEGTKLFDISEPTAPTLIGWHEAGGKLALSSGGDILYIVANNELKLLDISEPTDPLQLAVVPLGNATYGNPVASPTNEFAYIPYRSSGNRSGGIVVLDVTDPASPSIIAETSSSRACTDLALSPDGRIAYLTADNNVIQAIDISNPSEPRLLGELVGRVSYDGGISYDTFMLASRVRCSPSGDVLYVSGSGAGGIVQLTTVQAFYPSAMSVISSTYLGTGGGSMDLSSDGKILSIYANGKMSLLDTSDPTDLAEIAGLITTDQYYDIAISPNTHVGYAAAGRSELQVFDARLDVRDDVNGDGLSDLIFQDDTTGKWFAALSGDERPQRERLLGGGAEWTIGLTGDFNADGTTDILWRHTGEGINSGKHYVYILDPQGGLRSHRWFGGNTQWSAVSAGDYDSDGDDDVLWRNSETGSLLVFEVHAGTIANIRGLGGNLNWNVMPTSTSYDSNNDGSTDIILRHADGHYHLWLMRDMRPSGQPMASPGIALSFEGTGDLNGDGISDLVWRHSTGQSSAWIMSSAGRPTRTQSLGGSQFWRIVGMADIDGDSDDDLIWENRREAVDHEKRDYLIGLVENGRVTSLSSQLLSGSRIGGRQRYWSSR